ncbi:caspase [Leptospira santarosai]|uniref:caspase n=1 Tax=Leptospira santarosai TaxID=28183 RepID=UPI0024AFBF4D|nr:caspase [Leptospira santarosai]MDI7211850.1 caspase [Leptospira santarosai]MDI7226649.1 caspase [Leptospira santarosai]
MLKRKALLLGNSIVPPSLAGVKKDIVKYKDFLSSNNGGAWENSEILISLNEDFNTILQKVREISFADFSFVLIAGHGEHRITNNNQRGETHLWISNSDAIPVSYCYPTTTKSLIIIDVCREVVRVNKVVLDYSESFPFSKSMGISREEYRKRYENSIISNPEGRITLFSCDLNQAAGDNGDGGVFSNNLLYSVSNDRQGNVISVDKAFDFAKEKTLKENFPQSPTIDAGRRKHFYPFGLT